ncbi:MAG: hypothetical protein ACTSXU_16525 [Promethearchaeota archaeon]
MVKLKKKQIKAEIRAKFGTRSSLPAFLVRFGAALFLILFGSLIIIFFLDSNLKIPGINIRVRDMSILSLILGFVLLIIALDRYKKYRKKIKSQTEEVLTKWKSLWRPIVMIFALNIVLLFGLLGILPGINVEIGGSSNFLAAMYSFSLAYFFSSIFIIMALWYKTAPVIAKLIIRLHIGLTNFYRHFKKNAKPKIHKIFVMDVPQGSSFYMMFKRALSGMTFSIFLTTIFISDLFPPVPFIKNFLVAIKSTYLDNPANVFTSLDQVWEHPDIFSGYCTYFVVISIIPLIMSYILWFWLLPPSWLMDDAGLVYFRKTLKRRRPPVLSSIGNWFLSIIKPIVGGGALIGYVQFVIANHPVLTAFIQTNNILGLVQFSIIIYAFPIITTMITVFVLQLFQESQFNKLKTHLYQNLINLKIDPRITEIKFIRKNEMNEGTLLNIYGEGAYPNPPLSEMLPNFTTSGELELEENILPFENVKIQRINKSKDKKTIPNKNKNQESDLANEKKIKLSFPIKNDKDNKDKKNINDDDDEILFVGD